MAPPKESRQEKFKKAKKTDKIKSHFDYDQFSKQTTKKNVLNNETSQSHKLPQPTASYSKFFAPQKDNVNEEPTFVDKNTDTVFSSFQDKVDLKVEVLPSNSKKSCCTLM